MSTKFTTHNTAMIDSQTLKLVLGAAELHELTSKYLCSKLMDKGFVITPKSLNFLSTLECGVNYASEIARNIGVSRQMAAKTVKELCSKGYLEQVEGMGKQKQILFTKKGEVLMSESRHLLANIDKVLAKQLKSKSLDITLNTMKTIKEILST